MAMSTMRKGGGGPVLSSTLIRIPKDALALLKRAQTAKEVAAVLEVPWGQLKHLIYDLPKEVRYKSWRLPKRSGGTRLIESPRKGISILQNKVTSLLSLAYKPGPWVKAFIKGESVPKNAAVHCRRPWVLNIDLDDFYGSINFGRVRGMLGSKPYRLNEKVASILAQIVTYNDHLPQGAPSSPLISNMVAWALDRKLVAFATKHKLMYTRYADDITFSPITRRPPADEIATWEGPIPTMSTVKLGPQLSSAIAASGFKVNNQKLRLQLSNVRQEVTGVTVNEFPNVQREYVRNLRAMLNSWKKRGLLEAETYHIENHAKNPPDIPRDRRDGAYFKAVIYGHMAWLKSVRGAEGQVYLKLCEQLAIIDSNPPAFIQSGKERFNVFDFFICHAGEDKDSIAVPIEKALTAAGYAVFIDNKMIKWGDSFVEKINDALGRSKFIIAILSSNSVGKAWPMKEVNAVIANVTGPRF